MNNGQWIVGSSRRVRLIGLALIVCCLGVLGGCATQSTMHTGKGQANASKAPYLIGPGDQLQIYVRNNPDLSVTVPVRPDGKISIPLVQSIQATGKTPTQLANDLTNKLSQFIRVPTVTVIVRSFHGAYKQQIKVVGQAVKPQAIPYREGMTVLDVMIDVGGLSQFAAGNRAVLVRDVNGRERRIPLHLSALLDKGEMKYNQPVRPGDTIFIPESLF